MRGGGQIYPIADVVLTATVEGWSLGAGVVALRSFLTVLDCRVVIAGRGEGADLLSAAFSGDPRVRRESGEDAVPGAERWFFELTRPVRADEEFGDFLARQTLEDVGTFQILLGPESLLRARSARSRWRGRRHGEVPAAERERWFEHREFGPADCGLDPIDAEPALARIFGRY